MDLLGKKITEKYASLGSTASGANWVMMALNPAGGPLELQGIPDADAFPSVCMDYESVVSVNAPTKTGTTSWFCVLDLLAHPVQPLSYYAEESGGFGAYGGVVNPTLPTYGSYSDYALAFSALCNSYRMLYCGVTIDLDSSALNDQGSVVAGQFPLDYQVFNFAAGASLTSYSHVLNCAYINNFPGLQISQLPGAFMGLAKDGIYMPLKLDSSAPWVSTLNCVTVAQATPSTVNPPSLANLRQFTLPGAGVSGQGFPFYGATMYGTPYPLVTAFAGTTLGGDIAIPLQQTSMGHMVFYNLNPAAHLTVKVKWGVELRVQPTAVLAPALKPSAQHDALALSAYSEFAGSLPWAYPSEYNAGGKLRDIIGKMWRVLRPVLVGGLSAIPNPVTQTIATGLAAIPSFERPAGTGTSVVQSASPAAQGARKRNRKKKPKKVVQVQGRKIRIP